MRKMWKTFPNVDNVDNFFPHYPHAKTLDFKGFFKNQKKLSTFFLKLSTKKGRVIHIFLKYYVNQKMWITLWITFLKSGKIEKLSTKCG